MLGVGLTGFAGRLDQFGRSLCRRNGGASSNRDRHPMAPERAHERTHERTHGPHSLAAGVVSP